MGRDTMPGGPIKGTPCASLVISRHGALLLAHPVDLSTALRINYYRPLLFK